MALALLVLGSGEVLRAQEAPAEWETTGLDESVTHLATPAGGAFYAVAPRTARRTEAGAWRSDDGGANWRPVGLPPEAGGMYVDPVDHDVLYAANGDGMHKSTDGGGTWVLTLPQLPTGAAPWPPYGIRRAAISPADHNRIYLEVVSYPSVGQVIRSLDGGATWEVGKTQTPGSPSIVCVTTVVLAHETDPDRLLRARGCQLAESEPLSLYQSRDWGATWQNFGQAARPDVAVGWRGIRPERLYMAATVTVLVGPGKQTRTLGSRLWRSDDDGQNWQAMLDLTEEDVPDSGGLVTALTYDPERPDTVYIAVGTGVKFSADAGATWADLGRQDLPPIKDLALGVDGLNLYAATGGGVFRLRLRGGTGG